MAYHRVRPGPDPAGSFLILTGLVTVIGARGTLLLPTGTVWPGTGALPDALLGALQLAETQLSIGAETTPWAITPRDIEVAIALVTVQVLRSGPVAARLDTLSRTLAVTDQAIETTGHLLGVARETISQLMPRYRGVD